MMLFRIWFIFTFTFLLFTDVSAREVLSFQQCIDIVTKNNSEIQSVEAVSRSKKHSLRSVQGVYFPQLTASLSYQQAGPGEGVAPEISHGYIASVNATQNVFNGWADSAKVEQAQQEVLLAESSLQSTKAKVSYELKAAFANLLYAHETERIAQEFQKRREDNFRMVELRYQSGREHKGSLLLSQAYLAQSRLDVIKSRNARETTQSELQKVLGFAEQSEFEVMNDVPLNEPRSAGPDFKRMAVMTPVRQQAEIKVDTAQAALDGARSSFFPSLNLTASAGKGDDHFFPEQDRWTVGASLSWSLFGGGKDYYATKSAVANLFSAKSNLHHVDRQLLANLKKSYASYVEAVEELKVSEAFLQAVKSRAEIARAKYNNGLMSFDEWDIIENDLINRTKIHLQTRRDRIVAEAAWEQAQGIGVIP